MSDISSCGARRTSLARGGFLGHVQQRYYTIQRRAQKTQQRLWQQQKQRNTSKDRSLKDSPREALSIDRLRRLVLLERLFNRPVVSQRVPIHCEQLGMHERRGVENVMLLGLRHRQLVSERGGERYPENLRAPQARQPAQ